MINWRAMKSDTYTRAGLFIIALLLVPGAIRPLLARRDRNGTRSRWGEEWLSARWEYKLVDIEPGISSTAFCVGGFQSAG